MAMAQGSGVRSQLLQALHLVAPVLIWLIVALGLWVLVLYGRTLLEGL